MIKALILFGKPRDPEHFDQHFADSHRRLLRRIPEVEQLVLNRIAGTLKGDSLFHLIVELQFASEEAMQQGLNSDAGQDVARDFSNFASGGVSILLSQSNIEPLES